MYGGPRDEREARVQRAGQSARARGHEVEATEGGGRLLTAPSSESGPQSSQSSRARIPRFSASSPRIQRFSSSDLYALPAAAGTHQERTGARNTSRRAKEPRRNRQIHARPPESRQKHQAPASSSPFRSGVSPSAFLHLDAPRFVADPTPAPLLRRHSPRRAPQVAKRRQQQLESSTEHRLGTFRFEMSRRIAAAAVVASLVLCVSCSPLTPTEAALEKRHGGHDESHAGMSVAAGKKAMGGHVHHSGPAKAKLNETAVLLSHQPDPLSYFAFDSHYHVVDPATGALEPDTGDELETLRYPALLRAHVVTVVLAYFVFLPLGTFPRSPMTAVADEERRHHAQDPGPPSPRPGQDPLCRHSRPLSLLCDSVLCRDARSLRQQQARSNELVRALPLLMTRRRSRVAQVALDHEPRLDGHRRHGSRPQPLRLGEIKLGKPVVEEATPHPAREALGSKRRLRGGHIGTARGRRGGT